LIDRLLLDVLFLFYFPATLRVAGSLQKSTEVMTAISNLVRLPEINKIMQDMAKEMMKVCSTALQKFIRLSNRLIN
jgi:Snf7